MIIIGAGMAGLLAANMLRCKIIEAQPSLPNNHSAILRFRSSAVGDVLGIPFKKHTVIKAIDSYSNPATNALLYSYKTLGVWRSDRSIKEETVERYVAPPDFVQRMADRCTITYSTPFERPGGMEFISTIPMPALMKILDYHCRSSITFNYRDGWNVTMYIENGGGYATVYVPDPRLAVARVSLMDDLVIAEFPTKEPTEADIQAALNVLFGKGLIPTSAPKVTPQRYAKIEPIEETERRDFIYWASSTHGIYSLGRFATWRPGLLLDDLVNDIRLIQSWIGDDYLRRRQA